MKKLFLFLALAGVLFAPKSVLADAYSQGEVNYSVSIDKKIRLDKDNSFDNIDKDRKIFVNGDSMEYEIWVENTGKDILYDLVVVDYFPVVNQIILAPGEVKVNGRQITWKVGTLAVGERKTYTIKTRIVNADGANSSQTNVVKVSNNNVSDEDRASFFVSGKVMPVTGSNDLLIKSALTLSLALLAFSLRKLARGY